MPKLSNIFFNKDLYVRKSDIILISFFTFLFSVIIYPFLNLWTAEQIVWNNWFISLTFLPIIIISALLIISEIFKRRLSLNLMHIIFTLFFLGLAPLVQFLTNSLPFANLHQIENKDIVIVNILIIVWMIFYIIGYYTKKTRLKFFGRKLFNTIFHHKVNYKGFLLLLFLSALSFLYLWRLETFNLWTRMAFSSVYPANHSLAIITGIFVRAIPIIGLATSVLILIKRQRLWLILTVIGLVILNIFFNNPLAAARYWTGTILMGFAIIILLGKLKTPLGKLKLSTFFVFCIIIGLLVIFPLINVGRYYVSVKEAGESMKFINPVNVLRSGDFDAYANLIYTVHYVEESGIMWGKQLAGSLLFFIPRSIWPGKPVGSGNIIASYFNFPNLNIATPLPAEAIINFGIIGIPIFALIFGRILKIADNCFTQRLRRLEDNSNSLEYIEVIYPFWLGFVFFISRGGLMSSFAYTVGFTLAGLPLILRKLPTRKHVLAK